MTTQKIVKGDRGVLQYQVMESGTPKNITGMTFKFGAKENITDTAYKIGPITGTITDATNGRFSFTLTGTDTVTVFSGAYEIAMYDASNNRTSLTPAGGVAIRVVENIVD